MDKANLKSKLRWDLDQDSQHYDFFNYLTRTGRMATEPLPWSLTSQILKRLSDAKSLLDIGSDGGELITFLKPLPKKTFTILKKGNNDHIKRRLDQLGIYYNEIDDMEIPSDNNSFDRIVCHQKSYKPEEVFRVLEPEGLFLTQQVGSIVDTVINKFFKTPMDLLGQHWNLEIARDELENTGFDLIEQNEAFSNMRFYDTGAVAHYFKNTPWQVEDFDIDRYEEQLFNIYKEIESRGFIEMKLHRFYIIAKKSY